jgi:hypothetical protein
MAQPTLLKCWHTWNGYHKNVKIDYPEDFSDGHEVRKLHFLIKRCWKQIETLHPNNHGNLKRQFHHAARNVEDLTEQLSDAELHMNLRINTNSTNGHADRPEVHEDFYRVQLDLFRAIQDLVRIERAIGAPASYIKQYDKHRAALLRPPIEAFPRRLAGVRRRFEGYQPFDSDIDPPNRQQSRSDYQKRSQPDRNIDHHPEGSMYYYHLYTSHQTTAAVWVRTDEQNNIVERVVAKDCWFVEEIPYWADPKMWFGDSDDPTTKVPMEALIQEGLRHDSVLRLRGWHMHPHKLLCRVCSSVDCSPLVSMKQRPTADDI